ncbi:MAG: glycosyltransferase [Paracoccus sp. (in: a-proteobacteria)]|nr:glycosyltransferase [Paracoccus sp. (in: a-proteobacteria)]
MAPAGPVPDPDLLALMPLSAREVLLIGDEGCGGLAATYAARNPAARISHCEAGETPAGHGYDLVVMTRMPQDPAGLGALAARVAPGGHLLVVAANRGHWTGLRALLRGDEAPPGHTPEELHKILEDQGFRVRRIKMPAASGDASARPWAEAAGGLAPLAGVDAGALRQLLSANRLIAVATRADAALPRPLRLHQVVLVPHFMDVRTALPAAALMAEPSLYVTQRKRDLALPPGPPGIVIVQRPRISDPALMLALIARAQAAGWLVVVEYDDDPALVARVRGDHDRPDIYRQNLSLAHAVQTSTPYLGACFRALNDEVAVFANVAGELAPPRPAPRPGQPLRVMYGALNRPGTAAIAAALAPAIAAQPGMTFEVIHDRPFFDALPAKHKNFSDGLSYGAYLGMMERSDVVLMPLAGLPDERGKSDVKWIEAARSGAVAIASAPIYAKTIRDGETGFIARDPADWAPLLIRLAGDPDLRARVAARARAEVAAHRMMAGQVAARRDWYLDLWARRHEIFARALHRHPALAAAIARATTTPG